MKWLFWAPCPPPLLPPATRLHIQCRCSWRLLALLFALKRRSEPEDIAEAVLYLCAGASMVTGHVLVVDGGMTL